MKKIFKLLSGFALLTIAGCEFFRPPSEHVKKPPPDPIEIKKALLECGMLGVAPYNHENDNLNGGELATIDACMTQAGLHDYYPYRSDWCRDQYKYGVEFSICRPGAVIPQRSVKKRLNSPHCKKYKNAPECKV
ncbi:hypothetical protein [Bartonella harrusi]|uniref:Phage protein n=1 Tax=Bartonella harrusi TaxID=2961895 RepID=A0ABY5ES43_9HYPH|nr:hypothetical protein [Bartonella harrusi]UTO28087.1 hypothetical protein NMK50_07740 [Bartonella harrusi]